MADSKWAGLNFDFELLTEPYSTVNTHITFLDAIWYYLFIWITLSRYHNKSILLHPTKHILQSGKDIDETFARRKKAENAIFSGALSSRSCLHSLGQLPGGLRAQICILKSRKSVRLFEVCTTFTSHAMPRSNMHTQEKQSILTI